MLPVVGRCHALSLRFNASGTILDYPFTGGMTGGQTWHLALGSDARLPQGTPVIASTPKRGESAEFSRTTRLRAQVGVSHLVFPTSRILVCPQIVRVT